MALRRFAVVVGNEVAGTLSINDDNPNPAAARHLAAFMSDPKIVPILTEDPVDYTWTWDGKEFIEPAS